jgi:Protein of unknown function (DUF1353)
MRKLIVFAFVVLASVVPGRSQEFGHFDRAVAFQSDKGQLMTLLVDIKFTDRRGVEWPVPKGTQTDGASIPRVFWSIIGGPFDGSYRDAAVVHDYYCVVRTRSWKDTHRAFYEASRASGVDEIIAKTMYAAVYYFGPRWGEVGGSSRGPGDALPQSEQEQKMKELRSWIGVNNPDLSTIDKQLDSM